MQLNYFIAGAALVAGLVFSYWLVATILENSESIADLEHEYESYSEQRKWDERNLNEQMRSQYDHFSRSMERCDDTFYKLSERISKLEESQKPKKQVIYDVKN
jgi:hypothetical protein